MSAGPLERPVNPPRIEATWEWMCRAADVVVPPGRGQTSTPARTHADRPGPTRCSHQALPPDAQSARMARDFIRSTLADWSLDGRTEDVAVTVSELVDNALRYGHVPSVPPASQTSVWLGMWDQWSCAVCAVTDLSDGIPYVKQPDELEESGRGLQVISALSDALGWTPRTGRGKVVWALFLL